MWANRQISWHEHVSRKGGVLGWILKYRDAVWLLNRRGEFAASNGSLFSRISMFAGRTGTRLDIGKPVERWESGIELARAAIATSHVNVHGTHALSIGTRIRQAAQSLRDIFGSPPDQS